MVCRRIGGSDGIPPPSSHANSLGRVDIDATTSH